MPSIQDSRLNVLPASFSSPLPVLVPSSEATVPQEARHTSLPPLGPNIKVLMVWPSFPPSFWGFEGVLEMIPERAMTPPLGLITVAALMPGNLGDPADRSCLSGTAR